MSKNTVIKNSSIIFFITTFDRFSTVVLTWYLARFLGQTIAGEYNVATTWLILVSPLAVWGLDQFLFREITLQPVAYVRQLVSSAIYIFIVSLLVICAFFTILTYSLNYSSQLHLMVVTVLCLLLPCYTLVQLSETAIKASEKMERLVWVRFPLTLARMLISILSLRLGWGVYNLLIIQFVFLLLYLFFYKRYVVTFVPRWQEIRFDWQRIAALLIQLSPFVAINFFGTTFKFIDRLLLSFFINVESVAVYTVGTTLTFGLQLFAPAIMEPLFPVLTRTYAQSQQEFSRQVCKIIQILFWGISVLSLVVISLTQPFILVFYTKQYSDSILIGEILAITIVPIFLSRFLYRVMLASHNEQGTMRIAFINSICNLCLNILLIPRFGVLGACLASSATEILGFTQNFIFVYRHVVHIDLPKFLLKPILCYGAGVTMFFVTDNLHPLIRILSPLFTYLALAFVVGIISLRDIVSVLNWKYVPHLNHN